MNVSELIDLLKKRKIRSYVILKRGVSMNKNKSFLHTFDYPDCRLSKCLTTPISPVNRASTVCQLYQAG